MLILDNVPILSSYFYFTRTRLSFFMHTSVLVCIIYVLNPIIRQTLHVTSYMRQEVGTVHTPTSTYHRPRPGPSSDTLIVMDTWYIPCDSYYLRHQCIWVAGVCTLCLLYPVQCMALHCLCLLYCITMYRYFCRSFITTW